MSIIKHIQPAARAVRLLAAMQNMPIAQGKHKIQPSQNSTHAQQS